MSRIELDPAVYHAARTYLNLQQPSEVILEDAVKIVTERSRHSDDDAATSVEPVDLVIHDCFTGGSVPAELFTSEFWRHLASSIKTSGILVVVSHAVRMAFLEKLILVACLLELRWSAAE